MIDSECDRHVRVLKLVSFCCVLAKDTLRHFSVLGGLSKQLQILVVFLNKNFNRTR